MFEKKRQEGKQIALEKIPILSWAAFFALVFLGQVSLSSCQTASKAEIELRTAAEGWRLNAPAASVWLLIQVLNVAVYRCLGQNGTYYGIKFGKKMAWQRGFPFNLGIRHPQYVGAVMSIWGCVVLVWQQRPGGLLTLALYWTLLYAATAMWEDLL